MASEITLRQVASAAGVGLATASRALSGDPRCAEATRARVEAAATKLGYRPDPGVAALARRRVGIPNRYPLVWLWERRQQPQEPDRALFAAVRREAMARGYSLDWAKLSELGGAKAAGRILSARGVSGVFVPSLDQAEVVELFDWERFSVVSFLQENFVLPFDTVRPDLFYLMFETWRRARASGARRIGAVIPSSYIAVENELLLSACAYHARELPEFVPPLILKPGLDRSAQHYAEETVAWFEKHRPEVVIGKTEGAYWALRDAGYACPADFQFMTLRRTDERNLVAGYDWQIPLLAEALMVRMHSLVSLGWRGKRETPGTWTIPGRWCAGLSMREPGG